MLAVAAAAMFAGPAAGQGQRAATPNRIGWGDQFGESRFAEQMNTLSRQGLLSPPAQPQPYPRPPTQQPPAHYPQSPHWKHPGYHSPYWNRYGYGYGYVDLYDPYPYGIDTRVVYGAPGSRLSFPQPDAAATPPPPPPEPLEPIERARVELSAERYEEAVRSYRAHLAGDDADFAAAAELAAALVGAGRLDDAVSMFRLAYASDPGLAAAPLSLRVSPGDGAWRRLTVQAVRHAHRRETPAAWLAVSVLMQAEGRPDVAMRMLDRARDLGLDEAIATPLSAALR